MGGIKRYGGCACSNLFMKAASTCTVRRMRDCVHCGCAEGSPLLPVPYLAPAPCLATVCAGGRTCLPPLPHWPDLDGGPQVQGMVPRGAAHQRAHGVGGAAAGPAASVFCLRHRGIGGAADQAPQGAGAPGVAAHGGGWVGGWLDGHATLCRCGCQILVLRAVLPVGQVQVGAGNMRLRVIQHHVGHVRADPPCSTLIGALCEWRVCTRAVRVRVHVCVVAQAALVAKLRGDAGVYAEMQRLAPAIQSGTMSPRWAADVCVAAFLQDMRRPGNPGSLGQG